MKKKYFIFFVNLCRSIISMSIDLRSPTEDVIEATKLSDNINSVISNLGGIGIAVHKLSEKWNKKQLAQPASSLFAPKKGEKTRKQSFSYLKHATPRRIL